MVIFAIIVDRLKFVTVADCGTRCKNNADTKWFSEHYNDSKAEFWGASLACFILGAYIIAAGVYLYNTIEGPQGEEKKQA